MRGFLAKRELPLLAAMLLVMFTAGVIYSFHLGSQIRYGDEWEYLRIAHNIVSKHFFSLDGVDSSASRPPGYPAIIALLYSVGAGIVAIRMLNFAALCLSMLLLRALLRRFSILAGLLGPALVLGYPVLFYTAGTVFPQILASTMLLAGTVFVFRESKTPVWDNIGAGVCFGIMLLLAPVLFAAPVTCLAWLFWQRRRQAGGAILAVCAACLLAICPWIVRNAVVLDRTVFISSNSGVMLLLGNSEHTTANNGVNADTGIGKYVETATARKMDPVDTDRYFTREALKFIAANPGRSAKMYALKLLNYFNYRNTLRTRSEANSLNDLVMLLTYGLMLGIVVVRLVSSRHLPLMPLEQFCLLFYMLHGMFLAAFFTRIRYRLPADLLLIAFCALAISNLVGARLRDGKKRPEIRGQKAEVDPGATTQ